MLYLNPVCWKIIQAEFPSEDSHRMSRARRLDLLAQMLGGHHFSNQEELGRALGRSGIAVTQATLSRDLRSLGVIRRPDAAGHPVYELPGPPREQLDRERQNELARTFANAGGGAHNMVGVVTPPGHANGVARSIDLADFEGFVGSVAGDDTILVVMEDLAAARRLKRHLDSLAGRVAGAAK